METLSIRAGAMLLLLFLGLALPALAGGGGGPAACGQGGTATDDPELAPVPSAGGAWRALNARQGFDAVISDGAARFAPFDAAPSTSWSWTLALRRAGPAGSPSEVAEGWPLAGADRIDLERDGILEWFLNAPEGLRHGLELQVPEGTGAVELFFESVGTLAAKVSQDGRSVTLSASGSPVLVHRDLRALDADGRELDARWERAEDREGSGARLRLLVETVEPASSVRIAGLIASAKEPRGQAVGEEASSPGGAEMAPSNDLCGNAVVVPAAGPFPYLTSVHDLADATTTGDPPLPSCQANVSRSVWFQFSPSAGGVYTFSLCADAPTLTTLADTVLAVYESTGPCAGFVELGNACDDDSCSSGDLQSVVSGLDLIAGRTYSIVAWKFGSAAPPGGAAGVQLRVTRDTPPPGAPPNDRCSGAQTIPGAGPFPYLAPPVADIGAAGIAGDPPPPSCQSNVSRSIWHAFTPSASGSYSFSVCADAPTGTTVNDTVMAIYASNGVCSGLAELAGGCDDDSCSLEGTQSVLSGVSLTGGETYYVVVWKYDQHPPAGGDTAVQVRVTQVLGPGNDACGTAIPLELDSAAGGTTASSVNDYQVHSGGACFVGVGQTATTAPGGDVVYRFTAPQAGRYSFRVAGYDQTKNAVVYAASDCPAGPGPATIGACLAAANRNTTNPAEEVDCLTLAAAQTAYVYVDETSVTAGSGFMVTATQCDRETEPNGTPAAADLPACGLEGSIDPAGDADVFALGTPSSGSRVFAVVDGAAATNNADLDLRVTTAADTLEYDDNNNDVAYGGQSANTSGTPLAGAASYVRVNHFSATSRTEPYRLYASVQPPAAGATPESEPNDGIAAATAGASCYFSGSLGGMADVDVFSFTAAAGDLVGLGLDLDPGRDNTPFNGALALLDATGATLVAVNDGAATSSTTSGAGSLTVKTPNSPGEAIVHRIRAGGTYYARVAHESGTPGDYLLSITKECRIGPPTDLAVSQTDAADPVAPGGSVAYTILVENLGSHPSTLTRLADDLPAGSTLMSAVPGQGSCSGTGPVLCDLGTVGAGLAASVAVTVTAPATPGTMVNAARVWSMVIDADPSNDASLEATTIGGADADGDGVPDAGDCAPADPDSWSIPGPVPDLELPDAVVTACSSGALPPPPAERRSCTTSYAVPPRPASPLPRAS